MFHRCIFITLGMVYFINTAIWRHARAAFMMELRKMAEVWRRSTSLEPAEGTSTESSALKPTKRSPWAEAANESRLVADEIQEEITIKPDYEVLCHHYEHISNTAVLEGQHGIFPSLLSSSLESWRLFSVASIGIDDKPHKGCKKKVEQVEFCDSL